MADYETEEEQVEAIKAWWKKNGGAITTGIILGISVVFGWKFFVNYQEGQAEVASTQYERALLASQMGQHDVVLDMTNSLTKSFPDTNYASLSSLLAAKTSVDKDNLQDATKYLIWTKDHAPDDLASIARIRLARVQIALKKYQLALSTLNFEYSEQVLSDIEEVKGDALLQMGRLKEAKDAYEKALTSVKNGQRKGSLEMKIDDLAV